MNAPFRVTLRRKARIQRSWSAERLEKLIEVWNAKVRSVEEIATDFNTTRGSIVGAIFRLRRQGYQLENRIVGKVPANRPPKSALPKVRGVSLQSSSPRRRIVETPTPAAAPTPPNPQSYVDIQGLAADQCREVMVLSPKALYCGSPKQHGSSFCPFHHAKNWVPATRR